MNETRSPNELHSDRGRGGSRYAILDLVIVCGLVFTIVPAVHANCSITRDDGTTFNDTTISSCQAYYVPGHHCGTTSGQSKSSCRSLNALIGVDWGSTVDIAISPHRGIWGYEINGNAAASPATASVVIANDNDVAQNTKRSFQNAASAGFRYMEIDIILAWDLSAQNIGSGTPYVTHYYDLFGAADYPTDNVEATSTSPGWAFTSGIAGTPLTQRGNWLDQVKENDDQDLVTMRDFLIYAKSTPAMDGTIFLVDPKPANKFKVSVGGSSSCVHFCNETQFDTDKRKEQFKRMVESVISDAKDLSMLHRIVFKVPQGFISVTDVTGIADHEKVMWGPQPSVTTVKSETLDYLMDWKNALPDSIAFVEPIVNNDDSWMANWFEYLGGDYSDISDFIKSEFYRRTSIWIISPISRIGSKATYYPVNQFFGNFEADKKGDVLWSVMKPVWGRYAIVVVDDPRMLSVLRSNLQ